MNQQDEIKKLASLLDDPLKVPVEKLPISKDVSQKVASSIKGSKVDNKVYSYKDLAERVKMMPEIPKITSGFKEIDDLVEGGWEPGELVILSAAEKNGKTLLSQSMSVNQASAKVPVLWFTFEMGWYSITKRFMKMDWEYSTMKDPSDLPIYYPIDNRAFSLEWLRSQIIYSIKAFGIKIVYIDHLHYLFPMSEGRKGSVSFLVGEIIKEIKEMGDELQVTICLICHMTKTDPGIMPSKDNIRDCLPKGQLVYSNGKRIPIEKVKKGMIVVSKGSRCYLQEDKVKNVWKSGKKKIYKLITKTGCEIKCSDGQKFLAARFYGGVDSFKGQGFDFGKRDRLISENGWTKLKDLKIGQKIAIVKKYPEIKKETITPEMALILGWVIGDGHITPKGHTEISVETEKECLLLKTLADKSFGLDCIFKKCKGKNAYRFYMTIGRKEGKYKIKRNEWVEWVRELKFHPIGKDKFIPDIIFRQSNRVVGAFLSGLFQADGSVGNNGNRNYKSPLISYCTISNELASGVHHLLKRLGIMSIKRKDKMIASGFRSSVKDINKITIAGTDLIRFNELVGFFCDKNEKCERLMNGWVPKNKDRKSDLYFDKVKSIEFVGEEETFDIEVEGHHRSLPNHTYCVNDILTHNSSFIGQFADHVLILWRETQKKGKDDDILDSPNIYTSRSILSFELNRRTGETMRIGLGMINGQFYPWDEYDILSRGVSSEGQ